MSKIRPLPDGPRKNLNRRQLLLRSLAAGAAGISKLAQSMRSWSFQASLGTGHEARTDLAGVQPVGSRTLGGRHVSHRDDRIGRHGAAGLGLHDNSGALCQKRSACGGLPDDESTGQWIDRRPGQQPLYLWSRIFHVVPVPGSGRRRRRRTTCGAGGHPEGRRRFSGNAQTKSGGWGYVSAKEGNDFDEGSTTITQVQGLRGCRNAGIPVPKKVIEKAKNYIYLCKNADGGISYSSRNRGSSRPAITAAALAALYNAGDYDSEHVPAMMEYCKKNLYRIDGAARLDIGTTRICITRKSSIAKVENSGRRFRRSCTIASRVTSYRMVPGKAISLPSTSRRSI